MKNKNENKGIRIAGTSCQIDDMKVSELIETMKMLCDDPDNTAVAIASICGCGRELNIMPIGNIETFVTRQMNWKNQTIETPMLVMHIKDTIHKQAL